MLTLYFYKHEYIKKLNSFLSTVTNKLSWLEHCANNTRVTGSIPLPTSQSVLLYFLNIVSNSFPHKFSYVAL